VRSRTSPGRQPVSAAPKKPDLRLIPDRPLERHGTEGHRSAEARAQMKRSPAGGARADSGRGACCRCARRTGHATRVRAKAAGDKRSHEYLMAALARLAATSTRGAVRGRRRNRCDLRFPSGFLDRRPLKHQRMFELGRQDWGSAVAHVGIRVNWSTGAVRSSGAGRHAGPAEVAAPPSIRVPPGIRGLSRTTPTRDCAAGIANGLGGTCRDGVGGGKVSRGRPGIGRI